MLFILLISATVHATSPLLAATGLEVDFGRRRMAPTAPIPCTDYPTSEGSRRERCETGNSLRDEFEYIYNEGRGTTNAACGHSMCWCCRREKPIEPENDEALYDRSRQIMQEERNRARNMNGRDRQAVEEMRDLLRQFGVSRRPEFCWRDSYGRGVGRLRTQCSGGKIRIGALCYDRCPRGYRRVGVDCHQDCPSGFRDNGLTCTKRDFRDGTVTRQPYCFNLFARPRQGNNRCYEEHGRENCVTRGACTYQRCPTPTEPGVRYESSGNQGQLCIPFVDCPAVGMINGFQVTGRSCMKQPFMASPGLSSPRCREGEDRDGLLCYRPCRRGYNGVGPVCWDRRPQGFVNCGFGAAADRATCRSITNSQVFAVGTLFSTVVTFGASAGLFGAANAVNKAEESSGLIARLKTFAQEVYDWYTMSGAEDLANTYFLFSRVDAASLDAGENPFQTPEDVVRFIARVTAIFDTTGISSSIASFTYPTCAEYQFQRRLELQAPAFDHTAEEIEKKIDA